MNLWCQLIPQPERKLLLLQKAYSNTNVSTYANLHSPHEYSAKPFVPLGTEYTIHEKPNRWQTFAPHCVKAHVLGTSPKHYHC